MKQTLFLVTALFCFSYLHAQRLHLNLMGGLSNYGGDLQAKGFTLNQSRPVIAVGLGYELTEKFFLRGEYSFTNLGANDALSKVPYQLRRNLNFKTVLQEVSLLFQYDILNNYEHQLVPYVFAGAGIYRFSPYTYDSTGRKVYLNWLRTEGQGSVAYPERLKYKLTQLNIPFGVGAKFALTDNIKVGAEIGFRKLFTDYLDDVSTDYPDLSSLSPRSAGLSYRGDELKPPLTFPGEGAQRGNPSVKDNYYFLMLRLSFRLPFKSKAGDDTHSGNNHRNCPPIKL